MNKLLKHLLWEYSYNMSIRSITPEEVKKLGYHADYLKWVQVSMKRKKEIHERSRYLREEDFYIWNYLVTIYG